MKRLSQATEGDYEILFNIMRAFPAFATVEDAAHAFTRLLYDHFAESILLLRLFASVPYANLPEETRQFVDRRVAETGTANLLREKTPILALLGTKGKVAEWNERRKSKTFRCIPLVSTRYVASLSMLSMQFEYMNFDLELIDSWDETVAAAGRADNYSGMLYARNALTDKDYQGRMIVPKQDFVTEHGVRTALGFGCGYAHHPTLLTMFVFTNEVIEKERAAPLQDLLEEFREISENLLSRGAIFERE